MNDGTANPTITCKDNGPYVVSGLDDLRDPNGKSIPTKPTVALCRCGGSSAKPFCDGTHAKIGFDDTKKPDRVPDRRETYTGKNIAIHDNRGLCSHAGFCTDSLSAVWRMHQNPWIDPDAADATAIIDTIRKCPSGALSYSVAGVEQRDPNRTPAIQATKDGPYRVTGGVALDGQEWDDGASREHYTLCRCGASKNKPFCDGTHWDIGFRDDGSSG
ncbi:MAG: CDGSH iron-sulfur domain-containing protein [Proteobacteria bacterium]|nr:CDGSH iron-sulfur domain-containing protein [Pseudomonadota bacterium]